MWLNRSSEAWQLKVGLNIRPRTAEWRPAQRPKEGNGGTYVFADDLLQCTRQVLPVKDLDIFLDVARLGRREAHDHLEEVFAVSF